MICQNHEKVPNIIFLIKVAQRFYPKRTSLATTPITYPHSLISNKLLDNSCAQEPATSLGWKQWPDITSRSGLVLGESNGHPLQYSCLKKNPMDRGAWLAAVHGVAKSWTQLSDFTFTFHFHFSLSCLGKGNGNPLQCSCRENPRDGWALVGCRLWGRTESDMTEAT